MHQMLSNNRSLRPVLRPFVVLLMCLVLLQGCEKDRGRVAYSFNASIEQPTSDASSKSRLVGERWIYWDIDDFITLGTDRMTEGTRGYLTYGVLSGFDDTLDIDYAGVFVAELPEESKYFLGLFPHHGSNVVKGSEGSSNFTASIFLDSIQPVSSDTTFDHSEFPMVAWFGGSKPPYNLHFHSLGGIVRLQLFNLTGSAATISRIEVEDNSHQLWGPFSVRDYKTANPWLTPTASSTTKYHKLVLGGQDIDFAADSLHSFYLVLPALGAVEEGYRPDTVGENYATQFSLTVTVYTTDNQKCSRKLNVKSRRRAITYTPALAVEGWVDAESSEGGTTSPGIVGNGTEARPFKIYSFADLDYVRQCFASPIDGKVKVNGIEVTANSQFRIMNSSITLTTENWTAGISGFKGHISFYALLGTTGIVNNSHFPLFQSISDEGVVEGIPVRTTASVWSASGDMALLCGTNRGIIRDCHFRNSTCTYYTQDASHGLAGLCINNYGTIQGSGCEGKLVNTQGRVAGICLYNYGTVRGCYISSPAELSASTSGGAAGIVYQNTGSGATVEDCYFATNVLSSNFPWGGIVYTNNATVRNCYIGSTGAIRSTNFGVGGIVNTNFSPAGGTAQVLDCWCNAADLGGCPVGGIVATLQSGVVADCYVNDTASLVSLSGTSANPYAGGLVGKMEGGSIVNSFVYLHEVENPASNGSTGGLVGYLGATAGITNCYAYETSSSTHRFYGQAASTSGLTSCFLYAASQDGVAKKTAAEMRTDEFLTTLNSARGDHRQWVQSATTGLPVLTTYTITP